jgi:hypothetical protein
MRVNTIWELSTYDVWGNRKDGYEVNDVRRHGEVSIRCEIKTYNQGTPQQFDSASPSDWQLRQVFGVGCRIETDGDDLSIYVNRSKDGYPIGELRCTSHDSLSPIRARV